MIDMAYLRSWRPSERNSVNRIKIAGRILPYVAGLALVVLLIGQINPSEVIDLLRNAKPSWLAVGFGYYFLTNLMRAFRFGVLLKQPSMLTNLQLLPEMFALSFLNSVLPSRTGELSFPYFMQRRHRVPIAESATALLLARIFDYLAVITLFVFFALYELPNLTDNSTVIIWIVVILSIISSTLLIMAPWLSEMLFGLFRRLLTTFNLDTSKMGLRLLKFGQQVVVALKQMRSLSIYLRTFGWSVGIWLSTFAWFEAFLNAIGMPIRYTIVVVGATFASLAKALPLVTIGGFGAHEAGWSLGFSLTGMESSAAIASGFTINILTFTMSVLSGGIALLWMRFARSQGSR